MRKTKQKILLLFFFNIILLTSCSIEEDYVEKNNFKNNKISFRYLKGNEAMQKINLLENRLTSSSKFRLNNRQSQFSRLTNETIDYSKVLEVIDTSGVINYSYKVVNHPEDNETTFHNLVLTNDPYGNLKISLIKYQSENVYASIGQFHGTITTKSLIDDSNPCDNSTVGANFYTGVIGGTDGGTDIVLPPNPNDNNNNNPPFNTGSGGGGNSGNSLSDLADVTFICNSCNFASNSWAGFNGHRDGDGVIYPFTIIINRGHNRITNNEVENPCDNNGFIGIINDSIIRNPCDELNNLSTKIGFNNRMNTLKNNLTGTKEKAFTIRDDSNDEFSDVVEGDNDGNVNPFENQTNDQIYKTIGAGHNHLQNNPKHVGIFTPEDLGPLLLIGLIETSPDNPNYKPLPEKTFVNVLTNKGYFLMKINDMQKLKTFIQQYASWSLSEINEFLNKHYQNKDRYKILPTSTKEELIIGFLRFMNDYDLGVDLYEGDKNNFNNVKKLRLVDNGNGTFSFVSEPCI